MDSGKRKFFVLGIGAVAIGVAVVFFAVNPNFPPKDATGAIGAVQKHHETQISDKDVVLGDETIKRANKVAFADYLNDAAAMQKFAGRIGSMSQGNRDQLQSVIADLQSHQNDLGVRYLASSKDALAAMTNLLNRADFANKEQLQASVNALASSLANRNQLNAAEMANFDKQFGSIQSSLDSAENGQMLQGFYYYGGGGAWNSNFSQLESKVSELGSKANLQSQDLLGLTADLQSAEKSLGSREQLGSGIRLQSHVDYLGAMALQAKTLDSAIKQLGSLSADQMGSKEQLGNVANQLGSQVNKLESFALNNMQANLASQNQLASHLASAEKTLDSIQKLGSKANGIDNKVLESFNQALGSLTKNLQSKETLFQARAQGSMQAQLGAIDSYLGSREQLGNRQQLGAFQSYLGSLSQSLENKNAGLGAMTNLSNRDQLASQSRELANKAEQLGSKVNQ